MVPAFSTPLKSLSSAVLVRNSDQPTAHAQIATIRQQIEGFRTRLSLGGAYETGDVGRRRMCGPGCRCRTRPSRAAHGRLRARTAARAAVCGGPLVEQAVAPQMDDGTSVRRGGRFA